MQYTLDEVKKKCNDLPYTIIDESFSMMTDGFDAITDDGYKVHITRGAFWKHIVPQCFSPNNPYTIDNIKHYLELKGNPSELLSKEYINNTSNLLWKCSCGNIYSKGWNNFMHGCYKCHQCGHQIRGYANRVDNTTINNKLSEMKLKLINKINNCITDAAFDVIDNDGYMYKTYWSAISRNIYPSKFHSGNPYTINNINLMLSQIPQITYKIKENQKYVNNTTPMIAICTVCNNEFKIRLSDIHNKSKESKERYFKMCPHCNKIHMESYHAIALKSVFSHELDNTVVEDRSCVNPQTGRAMPTDIVNHTLKIAIEIQSSYHDNPFQIHKDNFKKQYWESCGYCVFAVDIRDYSILEMIQLFFPYIRKIPSYVNFTFSSCYNFELVQKLLDDGLSIKEISNITNYPIGGIHNLLTQKKIFLPSDYKSKHLNKKEIVQLDKQGNYINEFSSKTDADKHGYKYGTISRVLFKKQNFAYDTYWVYKDDYLNGNYSIPHTVDKYEVPIQAINKNNRHVKTYNSIYEASNKLGIYKCDIYNIAIGKRKYIKNYTFKFLT